MLISHLIEFFIHILTTIALILFLVIGYFIIKKFKGGLFAQFYNFIIIGAIPTILYHLLKSLHFFNIELIKINDSIEMIIEHLIVLFLFSMILFGTFLAYKNYNYISKIKEK